MSKVKKIRSIIVDTILLDKKLYRDFGFNTAFIDFNKSIFFRKNHLLGKKLYYLKYKNIREKIYNKYKDIIISYFMENNEMPKIRENSNIYFFWWQGIDKNTPPEIIQNLNSVKKNCKKHKVIVITKYNIKEYIEISDDIYDKLRNGDITITHFSDILRVKLLYTYGGIWSDASFYWTKPLPDYVYNLSIFSIKHGLYSNWHPCKGVWTVGFLASGKGCILYKYLNDMLKTYLKEYDYFCCYLLLDVYLSIAYDYWKIIKDEFDNVPYNNKDVFFFYDNGTKKYKEKKYKETINYTGIFRNHIKMKKSFETKFKKKTYYYQFYKDFLEKEKE